jgi:hypothetical protein
VYDDHYVLVDHGLSVVYDVLVVSVTSNRQFVCQFHMLLVMENDMMATISLCTLLFIFIFLCSCIKKGHSFSCLQERRDNHASPLRCCVAPCHLCLGSCTHGNRESMPLKLVLFMSSSTRVKTDNQVFGERLPRDFSFFILLCTTSNGGGD